VVKDSRPRCRLARDKKGAGSKQPIFELQESNEDIEKLVKHAIRFTLECTTGWKQSAVALMVPGLYKKWLKPEN
jgi:hypothetical protein